MRRDFRASLRPSAHSASDAYRGRRDYPGSDAGIYVMDCLSGSNAGNFERGHGVSGTVRRRGSSCQHRNDERLSAQYYLNPIFILPWGLNMGAAGAGLATFLSNCVACLYFFVLLYVKRGNTFVCIDPRKFRLKKADYHRSVRRRHPGFDSESSECDGDDNSEQLYFCIRS